VGVLVGNREWRYAAELPVTPHRKVRQDIGELGDASIEPDGRAGEPGHPRRPHDSRPDAAYVEAAGNQPLRTRVAARRTQPV